MSGGVLGESGGVSEKLREGLEVSGGVSVRSGVILGWLRVNFVLWRVVLVWRRVGSG